MVAAVTFPMACTAKDLMAFTLRNSTGPATLADSTVCKAEEDKVFTGVNLSSYTLRGALGALTLR